MQSMIAACEKPPFESLLDPLLPDLRNAARALTRNDSAAEDLVQETLLKAYRAYDRFEPGTNLRAWLHRILYNAFVSDFRRRRGHNEQALPEDLDAEQPRDVSNLSSNDLAAINETVDDTLKRALGKLNPDFRDVFMRAAIDDATHEEIARTLNLPVGTVMSRMHRARAFLRDELARN